MTMTGIPTSILKELRQALLQCDEYFASNATLRDLFSEESIYPFRTGLPERDSVTGRIEATIAHLANKHRVDGRNALSLFLYVLSDKYDKSDQRHTTLHYLAGQLSPAPPLPPSSAATAWNTAAIRDLLTAALDDQGLNALAFDHFHPVHDQFSDSLTRSQKIQLLIEYCVRTNQIETLLHQIERLNPAQYRQYQPHLIRGT
jgi:hypothetical protein